MREDEIGRCYTYEPNEECMGTSGRKLRQVCIYCPNYQRYRQRQKAKEAKNNEKGN